MKRNWVEGNVATEAIEHQASSKLFDAIIKVITEVRKAGVYDDEALAKHGLSAKIETHTGIATKFHVNESPFINASVKIPQIDKNHPILTNLIRTFATNDDLEKVKKFTGNKLIGTVDKRDSRVYGGFSKLVCPVILTTALLKNDGINSREIAAVVLHELGHVFSYFERLIDLVSVNYAIVTATEQMLKLTSDVDRIEVLAELDKYAGIKIPEKETVAKNDNKGTIYTHLACEAVKQRRNEEGEETYSYRGFEFSADQFATRHGAGVELVTALDKMNRAQFLNPSYISWPLHITVELIKVVTTVCFAGIVVTSMNPMAIITGLILILSDRPLNKLYDDPADRFARIDREMVSELKNRQLDSGRRVQILADLEVVREVAKGVKDKSVFWEAIWKYVIPVGRESNKATELQQSLERIVNNDLYVASALFK